MSLNQEEVLRLVNAVEREKGIDREVIFESLEQSIAAAVRKQLGLKEGVGVRIDRENGTVTAYDGDESIDPAILGRLAFQSARQLFVQRLREAESDTAYMELAHRVGDIVSCTMVGWDGKDMTCRIGDKIEARITRRDQVPGESFRPGDRFRALVTEVEKKGSRVRIALSRASEQFVRRLFELEVPEITDHTVLVKQIAREPGYRTKITVASTNPKVDCLGACVGVRGSRIRNVVDELNGENIDIIRWSENIEELIRNALKPAEVKHVEMEPAELHATVWVTKDNLSQAIGRGGRNVRLASKLVGWDIDIYDISEAAREQAEEDAQEKNGKTSPSEEHKEENPRT